MPRQQAPDEPRSLFHGRVFIKLLVLSGLVSLTFIAILGLKADFGTIFSDLEVEWLMAAVAIMTALQFLSGYRLYLLLPGPGQPGDGRMLRSVKVMFLFQASIKLLPFRLGEAGFFWLSRRYLNLPLRDTLGVFLSFRIWDLRVVALSFLLCGGLLLNDAEPWGRPLFAVVCIFGIGMFLLSSTRLIQLAQFLFKTLYRVTSLAWARRLSRSLSEAALTLDHCRHFKYSLFNGIISVATWSVFYVVFMCLYQSLGVDLGWQSTVMVVSGMTLIGIIPIQTLGGIGLLEFGQASLLILAGLDITEAAGKSLAAGGIFLMLCLGVPAALFLAFTLLERIIAGRQADIP